MIRKNGSEHKKRRKIAENQKGFTLVELIVTFALLGILMVGASYVISSALTVYYRVKATNYAQTVSDTILDKVCGELAGAQVGTSTSNTLVIADGAVSFYNRYGSPIVISAHLSEDAEDYLKTSYSNEEIGVGELVIHYRPVNMGLSTEQKATNWTFDSSMYMDYHITKLVFEQYVSEGKKTNVMLVTLEITNQKNGYTYEQSRYVECYNFRKASDVDKISYGAIAADPK